MEQEERRTEVAKREAARQKRRAEQAEEKLKRAKELKNEANRRARKAAAALKASLDKAARAGSGFVTMGPSTRHAASLPVPPAPPGIRLQRKPASSGRTLRRTGSTGASSLSSGTPASRRWWCGTTMSTWRRTRT